MMLIGSYERVFNGNFFILPRPFLKEIYGKSCVLAIPSNFIKEKCIVIFPLYLINSIRISDFLFLCGVEFDQGGKILIPRLAKKKISEYSFKIKDGDRLVFVGCRDRIEIWRKEDWEDIQKKHSYEKVLERIFYPKGGDDF